MAVKEIKYRAWDKKEREFINIKAFGFLENGEVWYIQSIDDSENEINPPYFTGESDLVIMQYTGLKDKNGKEIYEGDILFWDGYWGYYVGFERGCFTAVPLSKVQRLNWEHRPLRDIGLDYWEVKGDIYNNPEELED